MTRTNAFSLSCVPLPLFANKIFIIKRVTRGAFCHLGARKSILKHQTGT